MPHVVCRIGPPWDNREVKVSFSSRSVGADETLEMFFFKGRYKALDESRYVEPWVSHRVMVEATIETHDCVYQEELSVLIPNVVWGACCESGADSDESQRLRQDVVNLIVLKFRLHKRSCYSCGGSDSVGRRPHLQNAMVRFEDFCDGGGRIIIPFLPYCCVKAGCRSRIKKIQQIMKSHMEMYCDEGSQCNAPFCHVATEDGKDFCSFECHVRTSQYLKQRDKDNSKFEGK